MINIQHFRTFPPFIHVLFVPICAAATLWEGRMAGVLMPIRLRKGG